MACAVRRVRHASLPWSVQNVLERGPDGPVLKTGPGDDLVVQSLFAAYTFAQIMVIVSKVFAFDCADAEREMLAAAQEGLRFRG